MFKRAAKKDRPKFKLALPARLVAIRAQADAYREISRHGQQLLKEGRPLATEKDAIAHLRELAVGFSEKRLAVFRGMGIA